MAKELKKAEVDTLVRNAGVALIDTEELTQVNGNTYFGHTVVDGYDRYFEIKVVAKKVGFCQADIDALLIERAKVETRKAEVKAASAKKAEKDKARRAKAAEEKKPE